MNGRESYSGWIGQETPRKYTKSTYTRNYLRGRPKVRWTDAVQNDIRKMRIVNWTQVAQDRDGWRGATGEGRNLYFRIVERRKKKKKEVEEEERRKEGRK